MDEIIEAAANAIDEATIGYSIRLTKLVDGESEYTAIVHGQEPRIFDDMDDAREWVGQFTRAAKARAAIAAIMPAIGERMIAEVFSPAGTDRTLYGPRIRALANTMAAEVGKG